MAHGEQPDSYGGVLTKPAAAVVATLVALGAVLTLGWKLHDLVGRAEAAEPAGSEELRAGFTEMRREFGAFRTEVHEDMFKLKCRLNVDGVCPRNEPPPVRTSGFGR